MKTIYRIIRVIIPVMLIAFILICKYNPVWGEFYATTIYPPLSHCLSAISSLFSFPLNEVLIILFVITLFIIPILFRKKGWKGIIIREGEFLVWIYIWFYIGWGINYFREDIYTRLEKSPAPYNESQFREFLRDFTEEINLSYCSDIQIDRDNLGNSVNNYYRKIAPELFLTSPNSYQRAKNFIFSRFYSAIGVGGSMGPFCAEAQLNSDLLDIEYPFSYAHEFAHLTSVSNEAEANYYAYRFCVEANSKSLNYCGYFGILPYVANNVYTLLGEEEYQRWREAIDDEIWSDYSESIEYWQERYSPIIGKVQRWIYNQFLKSNKISSGRKNYSEVIGLILSLEYNK
mgnify:FL=1